MQNFITILMFIAERHVQLLYFIVWWDAFERPLYSHCYQSRNATDNPLT